ncbi:MAG: UvrD-helicase domain-containing protein [Alistipes finegoldii]
MRAKILNASAGSGKTYQLAYKYVRDVVEQPSIYRHILAVTFTNKATEEMKSRILKEIHLLASGGESSYLENLCRELDMDAATVRRRAAEVRSKILHDYSRFTVLTIDTFFQRILRAFIKELGIDLNYNVEIETASVLTKSADTLIEQITTDRDLQRWLTDFVQERIDEGKKWDVRDGILTLGGELFKEKNKEALSLARSREELGRIVGEATARAAATKQQMRERAAEAVRIMADAGVGPTDFTGKSRSFAHYFLTVAAGELKPYTATVGKMSLTTEGWAPKGSPAAPLAARLQPLLREMCDLYDANVRSWNTCDLLRENYRSFALLSDLYAKVQQLCDEQNMMLLSETKYILSEFIGHNDAPFIYEKVGNRFEHFMIDEFQDTSVKEWENFLPLLQNAMSQSEATSVLIVGDIKQSIYRWRGGDWKILHSQAQAQLDPASTEVEILRENYRSQPAVVEFNNEIIGRVVETDNRALNETLDEAAAKGGINPAAAAALHDTLRDAYRGHAQTPRRRSDRPGYVSVSTFAEQPPVVERICEVLDKGFRPRDIMILVRGATDGAKVAAELLDFKRRNTDPRYRFDVMTQEALIVGNAPVSSFIAASLRLSLNPDDSLSRAVYNHYLGRGFDRPLSDDERTFFRSIRLLSPEEAFERIVMRHGLQDDKQQTAYLQAIHEQIIGFCSSKIADIALFLDWWERAGAEPFAERRGERNDRRDHHDTQGQGTRKARGADPLLLVAAGPQVGRQRDQHRLGRGARRRRSRGTLSGEIQEVDGRIGILGGVLPGTGLLARRQRQSAVRGADARRRIAACLHPAERRQNRRRTAPPKHPHRRRQSPRGQRRRALHRHRNRRAVRIRPVPRPGRRRRQNVRRRARRAGKLPHGARRPAPAPALADVISSRRKRWNSRPAISAS